MCAKSTGENSFGFSDCSVGSLDWHFLFAGQMKNDCTFWLVLVRVARFLAAKYGRLLSTRDVRQGQYCYFMCMCLFRSIVTMAVSVAVCEIFSAKEWYDLENRVRVRSRSLEMALFVRSHTSSYSFFVVTMAVSLAISEISSVKEWPGLEMWVWGCSRSLKTARFDRPCMTFY